MYWIFISSILFLLSLAATLIRCPVEIYWNPDVLYLPTVLTDVLQNGGSLRSWSLASSPYLFPDLPLVFLSSVIAGHPFWGLVGFSVLQVCFFVWALGRFLRTLEPQVPSLYSFSYALLTVSFLLLLSEKFPILYLFLVPSMHIGAFLAALWAWPFLYNEKAPRIYFFPILSLLVLSDRFLLLELYVPAVLAWARRYGRGGPEFPQVSLRFFLSGLIGFGLHALLRTFLSMQAPNRLPVLEACKRNFEDFFHWLQHGELPGIFLFFALLTAILALFRGKERGFSFGFAGYFQLILIGIPPLTGLYSDETGLRYTVPAFYMVPALFGALVISRHLGKRKNSRNVALLGAILGLGGYTIFSSPKPLQESWIFAGIPTPPEAKCVDELHRTEPFVAVVADGKTAKRIIVYSREKIRAISVDYSTLEGSHLLSNREWYLFPPEGPYAVIPEGLGEARIRSFYGNPDQIRECQNDKKAVWIYTEPNTIRNLLQRPFQKTK